ncbi:MAG: class D sortase [Acidobacteriota bacterium]|nr:class D sortase [Acidobacteriota bacterium]
MRVIRRALAGTAALLIGAGALVLGDQARLAVKARVARHLIDDAYEAYRNGSEPRPPWPWADHRPIGRLRVPRLSVQRTILSGATGSSLAFGPGHVSGTAAFNARGNCAIAGHRDSWFAFLQDLRVGDRVLLETPKGRVQYEVAGTFVVAPDDARSLAATPGRRLTLITCYPFGGLGRQRDRYVVICVPVVA